MKKKTNWPSMLEAYKGCGLTQVQFCREHGINHGSFKKHLYRPRKEVAVKGGFTRLAVSREPVQPAVELHFPDGSFLRFVDGAGASYLCALITGLRP